VSLATGRVALTPAPDARAALVAALARVEGVTAHPSAPDNPAAFDAFPRWALSDYHRGRLARPAAHEYDVLVVLPAGYEPDTVSEGDSLLDRIVSGLWDAADIQTAEPTQLTFGNQTPMPALRIRVIPRVTP
jgi:hypothetical protein